MDLDVVVAEFFHRPGRCHVAVLGVTVVVDSKFAHVIATSSTEGAVRNEGFLEFEIAERRRHVVSS